VPVGGRDKCRLPGGQGHLYRSQRPQDLKTQVLPFDIGTMEWIAEEDRLSTHGSGSEQGLHSSDFERRTMSNSDRSRRAVALLAIAILAYVAVSSLRPIFASICVAAGVILVCAITLRRARR
jgi:hypothetical protein